MSAGLQVFNDNGFVQIDENYRNFAFVQKWSFLTAGDHTFTTNPGRVAPLLALYSTDGSNIPTAGIVQVQSSINADASWTYRVNGIGEVYLFDVQGAPPGTGAGLQVFNGSGVCVFDSSTKPLLVRDRKHFVGYADFYSLPTQTISVGSGPSPSFTEWDHLSAYTKPPSQKWAWVTDGFSGVALINKPAGGGPSSSPYGAGDGGIHKGLGALHAVGDTFVATYRNQGAASSFWSGNVNPVTDFMFVDITGL